MVDEMIGPGGVGEKAVAYPSQKAKIFEMKCADAVCNIVQRKKVVTGA